MGAHVGGHLLPNRTIADVSKVSDGVLNDLMREGPRVAPGLGVERFLGGRLRVVLSMHFASPAPPDAMLRTEILASIGKEPALLHSCLHRSHRKAAWLGNVHQYQEACKGSPILWSPYRRF